MIFTVLGKPCGFTTATTGPAAVYNGIENKRTDHLHKIIDATD
jgi:hypothetical protein